MMRYLFGAVVGLALSLWGASVHVDLDDFDVFVCFRELQALLAGTARAGDLGFDTLAPAALDWSMQPGPPSQIGQTN